MCVTVGWETHYLPEWLEASGCQQVPKSHIAVMYILMPCRMYFTEEIASDLKSFYKAKQSSLQIVKMIECYEILRLLTGKQSLVISIPKYRMNRQDCLGGCGEI